MPEFYLIIGPDDDGESQQYYNIETATWTVDFNEATRYDRNVLCAPLPLETLGVMKFNITTNEPMEYYEVTTLPRLEGDQ